jgi:hypothetical protein
LLSVRGAHASRGLPSSYCRNGSAGARSGAASWPPASGFRQRPRWPSASA